MTAGRIPSLASDSAILVLGSAITWSKQATSPAPPPSATPCMQPIVKHGCDHRPWKSLSSLAESSRFSEGDLEPASRIIWMSAPAQKCFPFPRIWTTLRLPPSGTEFARVQSRRSQISVISWMLRALSASVLWSVIVACLPFISSEHSSVSGSCICSHPENDVALIGEGGVQACRDAEAEYVSRVSRIYDPVIPKTRCGVIWAPFSLILLQNR